MGVMGQERLLQQFPQPRLQRETRCGVWQIYHTFGHRKSLCNPDVATGAGLLAIPFQSKKMSDAKVLRQAVEAQADWMVRTLRALVETESPSDDKAAVDAAVRLDGGLCGGLWRAGSNCTNRSASATCWRFGSGVREADESLSCCWGTWTRCGRWERCGRCRGAKRAGDFTARACWI